MSNWKLTLSYDGAPYHGWQIQPDLPTVQGTLQKALFDIVGESVLPQGSGRTDAGVHALGQVASVSLHAAIPAANLLRALNHALPPSIRVLSAQPMPSTFHARHSVLHKTYEYRLFEHRRATTTGSQPIERICSPFLAPYAWDCHWPLDLAAMQQAAADLCGTHDFTSFAASDPDLTQRSQPQPDDADGPNPIKTIHTSTIDRLDAHHDDLLIYRVTGTGFLHHLVRNLVGTLVDIGRGFIPPSAISQILAARNRAAAGPTAPPQGLYLVQVAYPPHSDLTSDGLQ